MKYVEGDPSRPHRYGDRYGALTQNKRTAQEAKSGEQFNALSRGGSSYLRRAIFFYRIKRGPQHFYRGKFNDLIALALACMFFFACVKRVQCSFSLSFTLRERERPFVRSSAFSSVQCWRVDQRGRGSSVRTAIEFWTEHRTYIE